MSYSVETETGRYYPWKKEKYVSVTTIIGQGIPKPGLNNYFVRSMAETAAKNRALLAPMTEPEAKDWLMTYGRSGDGGAAAILGSSVHALIDGIVKDAPTRTPTDAEATFIKSFEKFRKKYKPTFIETEATVFSRKHGYAGKLDFICDIDGRVLIGDYKTGKSVWPEAGLQVTAYKNADFIGRSDGTEHPLPECDGGVILHIRPTGYKVYEVDTSPATFDTFLSALDMFRWLHVDSENVIGRKW